MTDEAPEARTFGLAEVAAAIDIERGTLHSWLARRYIEVESPGTGRPRSFSLEQVLLLGAIADLHRHGIPVGTAAQYVNSVSSRFIDATRSEFGHGMAVQIYQGEARVGDRKLLAEVLTGLEVSVVNGRRSRATTSTVLDIGNLVLNILTTLPDSLPVPPAAAEPMPAPTARKRGRAA